MIEYLGPSDDQKPTLMYTCDQSHESISVAVGHSVEFNGTTISVARDDTAARMIQSNDTYYADRNQEDVVVAFGLIDPSFKLVSIIVSSSDTTYPLIGGKPDFSHQSIHGYQDDRVINVTPDMLQNAGLKLETSDFTSGSIYGLNFCVVPLK